MMTFLCIQIASSLCSPHPHPCPVVGTVTEETNDYFATRYWALKKSNDYFATRYWGLKKSNDYFATRYFPHRKCNDLLITSTCYFSPHKMYGNN
jgi:hypothetical protein